MRRWKNKRWIGTTSWYHRVADDSAVPKMPVIKAQKPLGLPRKGRFGWTSKNNHRRICGVWSEYAKLATMSAYHIDVFRCAGNFNGGVHGFEFLLVVLLCTLGLLQSCAQAVLSLSFPYLLYARKETATLFFIYLLLLFFCGSGSDCPTTIFFLQGVWFIGTNWAMLRIEQNKPARSWKRGEAPIPRVGKGLSGFRIERAPPCEGVSALDHQATPALAPSYSIQKCNV